jgi:hypothetical protein
MVAYHCDDTIATITIDDGKVNALSLAVLAELNWPRSTSQPMRPPSGERERRPLARSVPRSTPTQPRIRVRAPAS